MPDWPIDVWDQRIKRPAGISAFWLLLLITPIQAFIWHGSDGQHWLTHPPISDLLDTVITEAENAASMPAYDLFGRFTFGIYVLLLLGLGPQNTRLAHLSFLCLGIAALADVGTYWVAGSGNMPLRAIFFWYAEVPLLLLALITRTVDGVFIIRRTGSRAIEGWIIVATPALALVASAIFAYLPHGILLGFGLSITTAQTAQLRAGSPRR